MDGKGESQWKKDGKVRREEMAKKGDFAGSWFLVPPISIPLLTSRKSF